MKVSNPELKSLLFNLVTFTDLVDEKGSPVKRSSFKKEHYIGVSRLVKLIQSDVVVYVSKEGVDKPKQELLIDDVEELKIKDLDASMKSRVVGEKHSDLDLELDSKMLDAVKVCYKDRDELPILNDAEKVMELLEELLK